MRGRESFPPPQYIVSTRLLRNAAGEEVGSVSPPRQIRSITDLLRAPFRPRAACRFWFGVVGFPANHSGVGKPRFLFGPTLPREFSATLSVLVHRLEQGATQPSSWRDSHNPRRLEAFHLPGYTPSPPPDALPDHMQ
ncbi:hypothetical protein MTO96_005399 [Rhipicephalus appendiculatus]